jgi:hypothetical protein
MRDSQSPSGAPDAVDERSVARKYGLRELVFPDREQLKMLNEYLGHAIDSHKSGPVPKTAVVVLLEFLQGTVNRQHITKSPLMTAVEFDLLQSPYYLVTRVLAKIARDGQEGMPPGAMYQAAYASVGTFMELLRSLLDPGCYWLRLKTIPDGVVEQMKILRSFAQQLPEQRRKGRAM